MADYRLKIKIGDHEFEAEGAVEAVQAQFEMFKDLISTLPSDKAETTTPHALEPPPEVIATASRPQLDVERIFRQDGRVVSITVPPNSETDAVLLVLYGQRHYRKNEAPTGSEILDGMELSGYRAIRIDRILMSLSDEGAVIITGAHRGKRYRLTNQGFTRAEGVVREALAKLP
jgi:hypothetical protein